MTHTINNLAFIYTATDIGTNTGIKYLMTIDDAKKWCGSDISRGVLHGTEWSYFWTSVSTFVAVLGNNVDLRKVTDNGSWDDRLESVGVEKLDMHILHDVCAPYGVKIRL